MKIWLSSIFYSLLLFFAPIKGIIVIVALSTMIDTAFGVWKAKKLGEKLSSKAFRSGLVPKLLSYVGTVMMVYGSDVFIINSLASFIIRVKAITLVAINSTSTTLEISELIIKTSEP